jgi:amino acid transporter
MLTAVALIRLRTKEPTLPRPYRAWGYPFTPVIFAAGALAMSVNLWLVLYSLMHTADAFLHRSRCHPAWDTVLLRFADYSRATARRRTLLIPAPY